MFDHFRIPPELLPIGLASILTATLRTLIVGRQSVRVALLTWPVALLAGFLGGWITLDAGTPSWWALLAASAAAIMGENVVKGLVDLSEEFKNDPEGTITRWTNWWRSGGRPNG